MLVFIPMQPVPGMPHLLPRWAAKVRLHGYIIVQEEDGNGYTASYARTDQKMRPVMLGNPEVQPTIDTAKQLCENHLRSILLGST